MGVKLVRVISAEALMYYKDKAHLGSLLIRTGNEGGRYQKLKCPRRAPGSANTRPVMEHWKADTKPSRG